MNNLDFGEVVSKLRQFSQEPEEQKTYVLYGNVTSVSPITVQIEGFNRTIPAELIEISPFCRRYVLPIPHTHIGCYNPKTGVETAEIEVWRGLEVGDRVVCYRMNNGQMYYIAHRVEMEGYR